VSWKIPLFPIHSQASKTVFLPDVLRVAATWSQAHKPGQWFRAVILGKQSEIPEKYHPQGCGFNL